MSTKTAEQLRTFYAVRLPKAEPTIITDEHDEVTFHFVGLRLQVDTADGSFKIYSENVQNGYKPQGYIVHTGYIDKHGQWSYGKRSRWAQARLRSSEHPYEPLTEKDFDSNFFFEDDIQFKLKQRKVNVHVR